MRVSHGRVPQKVLVVDDLCKVRVLVVVAHRHVPLLDGLPYERVEYRERLSGPGRPQYHRAAERVDAVRPAMPHPPFPLVQYLEVDAVRGVHQPLALPPALEPVVPGLLEPREPAAYHRHRPGACGVAEEAGGDVRPGYDVQSRQGIEEVQQRSGGEDGQDNSPGGSPALACPHDVREDHEQVRPRLGGERGPEEPASGEEPHDPAGGLAAQSRRGEERVPEIVQVEPQRRVGRQQHEEVNLLVFLPVTRHVRECVLSLLSLLSLLFLAVIRACQEVYLGFRLFLLLSGSAWGSRAPDPPAPSDISSAASRILPATDSSCPMSFLPPTSS